MIDQNVYWGKIFDVLLFCLNDMCRFLGKKSEASSKHLNAVVKNIITLFGVHKKFPPDPPPLNEAYRLTIADFGASTSRDMRYGYKKAYYGDISIVCSKLFNNTTVLLFLLCSIIDNCRQSIFHDDRV